MPGSTSRRTFLQQATAGGLIARPEASRERPNVLLLIADQFRFDCLGANGNSRIRTPHLDALANQSAIFDAAYVQAPVCVPSRVTLLTGRYPHSHKNRVNYTPCNPGEIFLQRMLREQGYQTASAGKLHYYPPTNEHAKSTGFDYVALDDGVTQTDPYSDYVAWRAQHDPKAKTAYYQDTVPNGRNPFQAVIDYEYTPTHWTGEQSLRMLRQLSGAPQPFFLHCSFFKPHAPFTVPRPYDSLYDDVDVPLPPEVSLEEIQALPLPLQEQILRSPEYKTERARLQWMYRSYYASITMVDYEIGRILKELEDSGRASNTIVIFTTDHGAQMLEHGLLDKNVFFESSVHIPLLVRFPGRIAPGRYGELVGTIDILPSILELCGFAIPARVQGRSFAPLVTRQGQYEAQDAVFAENIIPEVINKPGFSFTPGRGIHGIRHPDAKMIRTREWKMTWYAGHGGELYDLQNDPAESRNLWKDPSRSDLVHNLRDRLLNWMITADEADQIAPKWLL